MYSLIGGSLIRSLLAFFFEKILVFDLLGLSMTLIALGLMIKFGETDFTRLRLNGPY